MHEDWRSTLLHRHGTCEQGNSLFDEVRTVRARDEWWTRLSFGTSWPGNYRARTPNAQSFLPHVFQQDLILRTNVFAHRLPDASRATLRESRLADLDSFLFLSSQL